MLLIDHYLCADHSVILIDEIENSLGVNCIDILGELTASERGLQYIITSHHPYIINNVPMSRWKVVGKKDNKVSVRSASELGLAPSKHEAFMELLQSDLFKDGVMV